MLEDGTSLAPAYGGIGVTPLEKWCIRFRRNLAAALLILAGRPCGLDRPLNRADRSRGVAARRPYDDARGAEYFREVAVADRGKQAPAAVRKAWVDIISARQKAVTLVVGFIKRLSGTVRASSAYPNAFAAMRHLASIDGNDTSICTAGSYNKYVRPALGGEFGSDARNTVVLFLAAFEEEMKNGGARALCGAAQASTIAVRRACAGRQAGTHHPLLVELGEALPELLGVGSSPDALSCLVSSDPGAEREWNLLSVADGSGRSQL